jgi:DNA-binding NtrC family response regulator
LSRRSVLIVEDDTAAARYAAAALREDFSDLRTAGSATEALLAMEAGLPDLILLDLALPDQDGIQLLAMLKQRWPEVPVIMVTAAQDVSTVVESVQRGATNYLVKPVPPAMLRAAAQKSLATSVSRSASDSRVPQIIGSSRSIVEVRHLVVLAARSDVNVLITGATGTGKELVARAIHRLSGLSSGPFVAHNCSLTPPDLFESQFFGHRRGSFTGADKDQRGLLEEADGGVLFLDELECLSAPHQAKLLRVIDDGEVRSVGTSESRTVSVRFLAATNMDPGEMVGRGALREDLYYRVRGVEIHLPPLRERRGDIPQLASFFLEERSAMLTAEALAALQEYPWPGNVRELRNVVRRARSFAQDRPIAVGDLGLGVAHAGAATGPAEVATAGTMNGQTLHQAERRAIDEALRESGGNRSRAARALGIDRSTLRRMVKRFHDA